MEHHRAEEAMSAEVTNGLQIFFLSDHFSGSKKQTTVLVSSLGQSGRSGKKMGCRKRVAIRATYHDIVPLQISAGVCFVLCFGWLVLAVIYWHQILPRRKHMQIVPDCE